MNLDKRNRKKKKYEPVIASIVMILLMVALMGLFFWANTEDPMPMLVLVGLLLIPVVVIVGVILALTQRLKEIEGGEENEASKY